jgi:hypothetical protein
VKYLERIFAPMQTDPGNSLYLETKVLAVNLLRSELLPPDRFFDLLWKFVASLRDMDAGTASSFASFLVREEAITEWQCKKLLAGAFRGFTVGRYRLIDQLDNVDGNQVFLAANLESGMNVEMHIIRDGETARLVVMSEGNVIEEGHVP